MKIAATSVRAQIRAFAAASNPTQLILDATQTALQRANQNDSRNTYLWRDPEWSIAEAERIAAHLPSSDKPLWGIPISVKDCFDLAGAPTSYGTTFYRDRDGIATSDSWLVDCLRQAGAVITGKTHLHPLAYGITGENPDFGDCRQPGDPSSLTGGSSSGAAASILEGSAMAAIGTDTGGSIRVPAALCGIAGYRASIGRGDWRGGAHLAASFDTMGWLFNDLEDGPLLGSLFSPATAKATTLPTRFAVVSNDFLHDCEPAVTDALQQVCSGLEALRISRSTIDVQWWQDSLEIFAPIQASEAAALHHGNFEHFEPSIRERLRWGANIPKTELFILRDRHMAFRKRMDDLLATYELLLLPAAPVTRLPFAADHSQTRTRLLRYTTPASLAGMPAVTIPVLKNGIPSGGVQVIAAHNRDEDLLALTAAFARKSKL